MKAWRQACTEQVFVTAHPKTSHPVASHCTTRMCCLNTLAVCSSNHASSSLCKSIHAESKLSFLAMGELASTVRQNGARSFVLPDALYCSQACSATILRKRDVETGHVASQLFFSASLRLKAWISGFVSWQGQHHAKAMPVQRKLLARKVQTGVGISNVYATLAR